MRRIFLRLLPLALFGTTGLAQQTALLETGHQQFQSHCAGCHGADGLGGERAPSIARPDSPRLKSEETIRELLKTGIPDAGMPAFPLPEDQIKELVAFVRSRVTPALEMHPPGDAKAGEEFFFGAGSCASCHMVNGRGSGFKGPDLTGTGRRHTLGEIESALLKPKAGRGYEVVKVKLKTGTILQGFSKNRSTFDFQLQSFDGRLHLLKQEEIETIEDVAGSLMPPLSATNVERQNLLAFLAGLDDKPFTGTASPDDARSLHSVFEKILQPKPGDWPTYHGTLTGNRYSLLDKITKDNIQSLAVKWIFPVRQTDKLEGTPIVVDGVMFVTAANQCYALDARSGREIWHYRRPLTKGVIGDAGGAINRGVAVLGDRVFMVTDNAHLLALHRVTGSLLWDVEMGDYKQHYGATSAPLVVNDLVISGSSGGDEGIRGFVAAYRVTTGQEAWRFWTIPKPGEPGSETWQGRAIEHGCVAAWLTGTYDAETNQLFWTTGNPCPDYNGDERKGDNLYADSVLALEPTTGKLLWHFQFTPHDLHDWDASETPMLVDTKYQGQPRKLLMQGNRNGYFYILDRTNGKFLAAHPFVKLLTWSDGIDDQGRPKVKPESEPTMLGTKVCPAVEGATNWMSTTFHPQTGLFYLMALEKCNIYTKSSAWWTPGESFYGGDTRNVPELKAQKFLRAIDIQTGKIAWEIPQPSFGQTWGGTLSTASGLLFYCDDSGAFAAADAKTGKPLWHIQVNQSWHASPMTYMVDGKQYLAVAAGSRILILGLP